MTMGPSEAIRNVVGAWERLDAAALAELFSGDGVYDDPLKPGRVIGPESIRDSNEIAMAGLRSCRIELGHVVEQGAVAFAEGKFVAELTGGGTLEFLFALVAEVAGGKITRLAEYFDTAPLA